MLAVNNNIIGEVRTPLFSIPKLLKYRDSEFGFQNILSNLLFNKANIWYRLLIYDINNANSIYKFGTFYRFSIPFIIFGFIICIRKCISSLRKKEISLDLMILSIFLSGFLTTLLIADIKIHRACELFFPLLYFLILAIDIILKKSKFLFSLTSIAYAVLFIFFCRNYYIYYKNTTDKDFYFSSLQDLKEAINFTDSLICDEKTIYVIGKSQPYIYTLISLETDPYTFNEKKQMDGINTVSFENYHFIEGRLNWDGIPGNYIYIFRTSYEIPWKMDILGFQSKQFGSVMIYYPPAFSP